ncbi:MAG TPA: L,D-transpeptidase family protein [Candidatus Eisenbacteria bacterium]|nr:L,D-transpeptidase family protein [Candidatus Eisenbacteria bacterium]
MRTGLVALSAAVVLGVGAGFGVAAAQSPDPEAPVVPVPPATLTAVDPAPTPAPATASPAPVAEPPTAPRVLWSLDDSGSDVRALEARLAQRGLLAGQWVDGWFGTATDKGLRKFQQEAGLPVTGSVDADTWERLKALTHTPTAQELHPAPAARQPGPLDPRCLTGRVLCIDKNSRALAFVVDGTVVRRLDVRFGSQYTPTREGMFSVYWKSADHVSNLYGSSMPYAMFFSGGQAVHYSRDFAARGYAGASHGCVNTRDKAGTAALFAQVRVGDKVVIYRG